jgi:sensor histidine kinase YesM
MRLVEKIVRNRLLQHVAFWGIAFFILLKDFQTTDAIIRVDIIYTAIFIVFIAAAVYVNLLWLVPQFFNKGQYGWYALFAVVMLIGMTFLYRYSFDIIVAIAFRGYYLISYFEFWSIMKYFAVFFVISSLLHFSKSYFLYKDAEARLSKAQKEIVQAELNALKSQVNPHFLFNSLNSIYSLVLKKSASAPMALVRLSDILRYVIYESNEARVPLHKELTFLSNYVALQKLRMRDQDSLTFDTDGVLDQQKIAPLLLIPIIENTFKHGEKGSQEGFRASIEVRINDSEVYLHAVNNVASVDIMKGEKDKGTGLDNLRKRLEMIYPKQHQLQIHPTQDTFTVDLKIKI